MAISVSACVRSGVRRKPASADTPTWPRTDFAFATSMRGSVQFVSPSGLVAFEAQLHHLPAGDRLAIDQPQFGVASGPPVRAENNRSSPTPLRRAMA